MRQRKPYFVGLGGTTRTASTSERALAVALGRARDLGAETRLFAGPALLLDAYDPSAKSRSPGALDLVDALRRADGILIASPGYHGSISGLIKNALDYTEDMRGDERPYFEGRAVGCIVCADGAQALGSTLQTLRSIVHALRGWPTPFAAAIHSGQQPFDADGRCRDGAVAAQLALVAEQVMQFARMQARSVPDLAVCA